MEQFPLVIQWKLFRTKQHFDEALRELGVWFSSDPGHLGPAPESTSDKPLFMYVPKEPVPARFGLIAGDFFQNLRSVTCDYLVWLLVEANGKTPKRCNAFPVCTTQEGYKTALQNNRLKGVSPEAKKIIHSLQPAFLPSATPNELTILDELVNENKHRTPLSLLHSSVSSSRISLCPSGISSFTLPDTGTETLSRAKESLPLLRLKAR